MSSSRARFTLEMSFHDNESFSPPLRMAVDLNQEVRIAPRFVDELKLGLLTSSDTIEMMRVREMRKDLFIEAARRLGALLAERMEDAEGWHDASRVEPARRQLGGKWE